MMQAAVPYDFDLLSTRNFLPVNIGIGKTWLLPALFDELRELKAPFNETAKMKKMQQEQMIHNQRICKIFREELVMCLERLRVPQLENVEHVGEIHKPKDWGQIPKRYEDLIYKNSKKHLQPPKLTKESKEVLKKEFQLRNKIALNS